MSNPDRRLGRVHIPTTGNSLDILAPQRSWMIREGGLEFPLALPEARHPMRGVYLLAGCHNMNKGLATLEQIAALALRRHFMEIIPGADPQLTQAIDKPEILGWWAFMTSSDTAARRLIAQGVDGMRFLENLDRNPQVVINNPATYQKIAKILSAESSRQ